MQLFTPTKLTKAVHNCKNLLQKIANDLTLDSNPLKEEKKKEFISAYESYDDEKVNKMITDGIADYLGSTNISYGLENFCKKYKIYLDFSDMSETDIILNVAKYSDEIIQRINEDI